MKELLHTNTQKAVGLIAGFLLVLVLVAASIIYGYTDVTWQTVIDSFLHYNGSREQIVVREQRIPRAIIGAAAGASLAIAGAIMQGLTRNPLASPGIFGINSGAAFFVVLAVTLFSVSSLQAFTWIAFFGAAVTAATVFVIGSLGRDGATPIKLTLAGSATTAMFSAWIQGLLVVNEKTLEEVMFWLVGSVEGRNLEALGAAFPYLVTGWIGAMALARPINTLLLGEDVAKGLGQRTWLVKGVATVMVILLAGGTVAVAGPIGFVGIVVPHLARGLFGYDYRWLIPACFLLGASLLVLADIGARYIVMPEEVPVGVMTALVGVPFFIAIARRRVNGG
jgi:iron complex transport system permease protein